ncbi:sensor histidine kinase [Marasmitruncus massiliensis]|uniref:sensor histidine kinase n=1 Tax=Marasmitruncus massiliensis TaxID=1944642 RepID=UPI0015E09711|nr:sensor histidine kinase [Marasmitruncus massiliensis]
MWKISFRAKLILIFIVVAIVQGTLIGYYSHQYASEIVMSNKKSDMADLVNRIDININDKVRYMTRQIENTVSSHVLRNYLDNRNLAYDKSAYFSEYFHFMANSFSAITNVMILDESGILYDQDGGAKGLQGADRLSGIFQAVSQKNGQAVWLGMVDELSGKRDEVGKQVISVASAIVNPATEKTEGILLIELDPDSFSSMLLNNYNTYQNQYTFIIDKKWEVICSNKLIDSQWVDLIAAEFDLGNRRFEMNWQGKDYYVCGQYNGVTGWETFSVIAKDNIFTQTKELLQLIKAFVILCTFGVSMIIMAISYTMTKPLQQLSEAMRRLQAGDFSQQIKTERRDEIGRLISSFNYMAKKIDTLINEVYQEKIAQKNAEIKALQSQINPHFLYNTLDSINWMAIDRGAYDVSDIIIALGDLMKYSVDQHSSMVRLEQEMRYVVSYLRIQKNRLEEKLQYEIEIPVALITCLVPKLMLQPIVENAITHGIEPMKQGGLIRIEGRESNGIIYIEVSDNGKGMDQETLERIMHHIDHEDEGFTNIGVRNVHKRIQLHYGDEYGLEIESAPGKGTKIIIRIPHREGGIGSENYDR